ncbi:glycosyltransferase family 4 protein [Halorubrum depositum]|uniref:glycosyltransferase family 4 protein n=1 Tax=Halorubrum depositum TaxID=2583992 RepID=UPI0011A5E104|nr:glycosyltransferase family 4 protein [Halorubrum depositum]
MKILFVTHRYPPRTGGVETHVREISTRLADRGHDVTVFSADAGDDVPTRTTDESVRVRRFRSLSPDEAFYFAPQMAAAVRRVGADVVHAHNYHAFPLFFAAVGITDERFIVTTHYHGKSASGFRDLLLSAYRPFGKWAVRQADEIIAVSEWECDRLHEDIGVNATVIPNGINVDRFANTDPEKRERPYLLCVGRLEEYKGIQQVIRALPELSGYDLVIAGSGPYREELERIARETKVSDRVHFLGYVEDRRLPRLYAGAEVYLSLSEFEAYGITVSEALAAGTSCVVREAGALKDWLDGPAVEGVTVTSPDAISEVINKVLGQNPECDVPSWSKITDQLLTRYLDQAEGNRHKHRDSTAPHS